MNLSVLVVGAGPAGLAASGCLVRRGLRPDVIEQSHSVGSAWLGHYERLHLHTVKSLSSLPGLPFPADAPRYVPRAGVVDYLRSYAEHHGIRPRFGEAALAIEPEGGGWVTLTGTGRRIASDAVVVATGANRVPLRPSFAGEDDYTGRVLHSREYRDAVPFAGRRVLVVGMGNTGAEIALDLAERGAHATLSVRSPVNIVHRDVLGRPTQKTSLLLARLPARWGDLAARVLRDATVGDLRRWGLRTAAESPLRQLREHGRTPVIDVGTLARIKSGDIAVRPGIECFTPQGVRFTDGREEPFDAVVLATGYAADVQPLFPRTPVPVDERGLPRVTCGSGTLDGIHFVGFDIRQPGGLLRTIGEQAEVVAEAIAQRAAARAAMAVTA
jgi:cation diffusion facilitator CzcD-associated flavoprotein CzcO